MVKELIKISEVFFKRKIFYLSLKRGILRMDYLDRWAVSELNCITNFIIWNMNVETALNANKNILSYSRDKQVYLAEQSMKNIIS
jgi:hypothetical protein